MHSNHATPNLLQAANQAQEAARLARQNRMALAFQVLSAVNLAVLTGVAATHLYRDIRRAENEKGRGR
jgi:hypothetical protein